MSQGGPACAAGPYGDVGVITLLSGDVSLSQPHYVLLAVHSPLPVFRAPSLVNYVYCAVARALINSCSVPTLAALIVARVLARAYRVRACACVS